MIRIIKDVWLKIRTYILEDGEDRLTTIETFKVLNFSMEHEARVDTGARVCSLDAQDIKVEGNFVTFSHEGKDYKMNLLWMKEVTNANGIQNRPCVLLNYSWNKKKCINIETTLADRSAMKFKLLIGRNLISNLKLPVYISVKE